MSYSSYGIEKGQLIRVPATANLMLDSKDRNDDRDPSCWDFQFTKNQALLNGFFTRIGVTEFVLEWCEPNISSKWGNNTVYLEISGTAAVYNVSVTLDESNYTVYSAMNALAQKLNDISGTTGGSIFVTNVTAGGTAFLISQHYYKFTNTDIFPNLVDQLGFTNSETLTLNKFIDCPDLRPTRYIDFVCDDLTSVQDVKDAATTTADRTVILRWYLVEDVPVANDPWNYPILQGYLQFQRRRLYNPPKQIKWEQNRSVSNLKWSVYDSLGNLLPASEPNTEWLATLQLSEG